VTLPPFHWWRTVFYLIPAIAIYTILLGTVSIAAGLLGRGRLAHRCARLWSRLILVTTGVTIDARGLEHVQHDRAALYLSNHQSIYDIPILFHTVAVDLRIIAKASLGRFPFLGWHLARTGHVLVDRRKPGSDVFRQVSNLMRSGASLLVFPEGTRSVDGRLGRFKGGIFLLAIEAGLPIVPVAVRRSRFVMRKGRLMTCPGHVEVELFAPIGTEGLGREDAKPLAQRVQAIVADALAGDVDPPREGSSMALAAERRA
jgi:1-acyl-sn-glycerol-3-phosphate acyltransferase